MSNIQQEGDWESAYYNKFDNKQLDHFSYWYETIVLAIRDYKYNKKKIKLLQQEKEELEKNNIKIKTQIDFNAERFKHINSCPEAECFYCKTTIKNLPTSPCTIICGEGDKYCNIHCKDVNYVKINTNKEIEWTNEMVEEAYNNN